MQFGKTFVTLIKHQYSIYTLGPMVYIIGLVILIFVMGKEKTRAMPKHVKHFFWIIYEWIKIFVLKS